MLHKCDAGNEKENGNVECHKQLLGLSMLTRPSKVAKEPRNLNQADAYSARFALFTADSRDQLILAPTFRTEGHSSQSRPGRPGP